MPDAEANADASVDGDANGDAERRLGMGAGLAAYGLWGLFPLYFHALQPAGALEILGHRIVWSFVLCLVVLGLRRQRGWIRVLRDDPGRAAAIVGAGLLLATNWVTYVWAVNADRVIDASLGYFINPIITVVVGVVVLKESIRPLQRVAVALGAISVVVLTLGYGEVPWIALVLACTFAGYSFLKKQVQLPTVESLAAETMLLFPLALGGLVWLVARGESAFTSHGVWLDLKLIGLGIVTSIPLLLFGVATRRIPLVMIGLLQYITPFGQLLLGWWWFGEQMPPERWAGFVLIWAALAVLTTDALRASAGPNLGRTITT